MLNDQDASDEISRSIKALGENIETPSNVFAYPTGRASDYTCRESDLLEQLGVQATVSAVTETFVPNRHITTFQKHSIPRFAMPSSKIDFIQCTGWLEYLKQRAKHKSS